MPSPKSFTPAGFGLIVMLLLSLLITLIPAVTAVHVTKEDADVGLVQGFTHQNASSHDGDYLVSTFCYCGFGMNLNDTKYDEAHYFQFDYYNYHLNTTFILQHFCSKAIDDKNTCYGPRTEDGSLNLGWRFDWSGGVCKSWPRAHFTKGYVRVEDEFCYYPHYANRGTKLDDYITYNGQKRDVSDTGNQGYRTMDQYFANKKCDNLCFEYHDMPVMEDNKLATSRVVINDHVDDMCDHCK